MKNTHLHLIALSTPTDSRAWDGGQWPRVEYGVTGTGAGKAQEMAGTIYVQFAAHTHIATPPPDVTAVYIRGR